MGQKNGRRISASTEITIPITMATAATFRVRDRSRLMPASMTQVAHRGQFGKSR